MLHELPYAFLRKFAAFQLLVIYSRIAVSDRDRSASRGSRCEFVHWQVGFAPRDRIRVDCHLTMSQTPHSSLRLPFKTTTFCQTANYERICNRRPTSTIAIAKIHWQVTMTNRIRTINAYFYFSSCVIFFMFCIKSESEQFSIFILDLLNSAFYSTYTHSGITHLKQKNQASKKNR